MCLNIFISSNTGFTFEIILSINDDYFDLLSYIKKYLINDNYVDINGGDIIIFLYNMDKEKINAKNFKDLIKNDEKYIIEYESQENLIQKYNTKIEKLEKLSFSLQEKYNILINDFNDLENFKKKCIKERYHKYWDCCKIHDYSYDAYRCPECTRKDYYTFKYEKFFRCCGKEYDEYDFNNESEDSE